MVGGASRVRRREQTQRGRPRVDANRAPHRVQVQDASAKTEIGYRVAQRRRLPFFAHDLRLRTIPHTRRLRIRNNCNIR